MAKKDKYEGCSSHYRTQVHLVRSAIGDIRVRMFYAASFRIEQIAINVLLIKSIFSSGKHWIASVVS